MLRSCRTKRAAAGLGWLLSSALSACAEPRVPGSGGPEQPSLTGGTEGELHGGQSGTDAPSSVLDCPEPGALDRSMDWLGTPLDALLQPVFGSHAPVGSLFQREQATLQLTVRDLGGGSYTRAEPPSCEVALIPVELSVVIPGQLALGPQQSQLEVSGASQSAVAYLRFDETALTDPDPLPPLGYSPGGVVRIHFQLLEGLGVAIDPLQIAWDATTIGAFRQGWPPRHEPDPSVAAECASAEVVREEPLLVEAEVLAWLAGDWALCNAPRPFPFAGVRLREDRSWSAIASGEELALSSGFQREGRMWIVPNYTESGLDSFHVDLKGPGWSVPIGTLLRSASGDTLSGGDARLVRIRRPVATAPAPTLPVGTRGGAAGCSSPETGFEPWFSDEASLEAAIAGRWTICSGGTGSVVFGPGQVQVAGGAPRAYTIGGKGMGLYPDGYSRSLHFEDEVWNLTLASHPRKLGIIRQRWSTGVQLEPLILSAEP